MRTFGIIITTVAVLCLVYTSFDATTPLLAYIFSLASLGIGLFVIARSRHNRAQTRSALGRLDQLHSLFEKGALTRVEFEREKSRLLGAPAGEWTEISPVRETSQPHGRLAVREDASPRAASEHPEPGHSLVALEEHSEAEHQARRPWISLPLFSKGQLVPVIRIAVLIGLIGLSVWVYRTLEARHQQESGNASQGVMITPSGNADEETPAQAATGAAVPSASGDRRGSNERTAADRRNTAPSQTASQPAITGPEGEVIARTVNPTAERVSEGVDPAPLTPPTPAQPGSPTLPPRITRALILEQPASRDLQGLYPREALLRGVTGSVRIRCTVRTDGGVDCAVLSENPAGWMFGEASLQAARRFRIAQETQDGQSTAGAIFERTINWALE